jgi:hypothetical protein
VAVPRAMIGDGRARSISSGRTTAKSMKTSDDNLMKEWETSRELLKDFDERLHDLRKYGFTFVTGLLAVEGFLVAATDVNSMVALVKWSVIAVNLLLIVSLRVIDRNYQIFQGAAATRALVLERILNLELTEIISDRYANRGIAWCVTVVYLLLATAVLFLGRAALGVDETIALTWIGVAVAAVLVAIHWTVKVEFPNGQMDWTLECVDCTRGDSVGITVTNLSAKRTFVFERPVSTLWSVRPEEGGTEVASKELEGDLPITKHSSHTWLLDTGGWPPGVYRIERAVVRKRFWKKKVSLEPLARKLRVRQPERGPLVTKLG